MRIEVIVCNISVVFETQCRAVNSAAVKATWRTSVDYVGAIAVSVNKRGDVASTELCLRRVLCRLFRNALNMHEMMKLHKVVFKISLAVAASLQTPPAELATLFQRRSRQGRRKPLPYALPIAALIIAFGDSFYSRPRTRLKNSAPVRWG